MKQLIIMICLLITVSLSANSQKIFNLDTAKSKVDYTNPETLKKNSTLTNNIAIYKGVKYPVYKSKNNKLFIVVQSQKTKNWYRKYLKTNQFAKHDSLFIWHSDFWG